jgi:hypothetical protein
MVQSKGAPYRAKRIAEKSWIMMKSLPEGGPFVAVRKGISK